MTAAVPLALAPSLIGPTVPFAAGLEYIRINKNPKIYSRGNGTTSSEPRPYDQAGKISA